jgi:hypothetical protein
VKTCLACLVAAGVVVACGTSDAPAPARPTRPSTVHVEGGAIRDPSGRTVILRGVNVASAHKQKPYYAPTEIRVPARVYPRGVMVECGGCTVEETPGLVRLRTPPPGNPVTVTLRSR